MTELLEELLPNGFNVEVILNAVVVIYTFVVSIVNIGAKKRVIKSDIQATNSELKAQQAVDASINSVKAVTVLSNMLLSIFLNANTLDDTQKKQLVVYAQALDKVSGIKLDATVSKVIDIVKQYQPESTIVQQKEFLVSKAKETDAIIDSVNDDTKKMLEQLDLK